MTEVTVTAPSRLHFGLLDLGGASPRRYGGVGLMVDAFPTIVTARTARATTVTASAAVDRQHRSAVMRALTELPHTRNVSVNIDSAAPPHLGLGSKTSLVLACLRAADELQPKSSGRAALQRASGRGGTSGIGVNGFFTGGFLLDGGHPKTNTPYQPSRSSRPHAVAPILCSLPFPAAWNVWLLVPQGKVKPVAGKREVAFFAKHTPLRPADVYRATSIALLGIAAAVATLDLSALAESLAGFSACGFKRCEVSNQPGAGAHLRSLHRAGFAAGMSSLGPTIFAISGPAASAPACKGLQTHGPFKASNAGARVRRAQ